MSTVGLSFGSPTSGAGFDVSSTVSTIVANLQNVETPWKTQLTSLESQDTAISSLGTLFSTLSTDISSLTDLEGVMAEKEGSSSDESVLTLTSADATAVAGTYTVEVTNLAQTSSGYLAEVSDASSTLSGSVTLQVGSGTKLALTLSSSDNTLATLASTINASDVGITANVITDASGSRLSLVSGTSGAAGNITVSNNSIVAASTSLAATVTAGTDVSGSTAATASTSLLMGITNATDKLTGSISIQVGTATAVSVKMPTSPDNTLSGLADAINKADTAVTATVVTNGDGTSSLKLVSATTGTAGDLTVDSGIVDTSNSLGYVSSVTGKNANLTVDGIAVTSASNAVSDVIPGVTFQILAPSSTESDGSLEQVQVVIANDNTGVESAVSTLVSDYNAAMSAVNAQEGKDSSGNNEPLFGSPTLSLLQQQLLSGVNMTNPNGTLTSITDGTNTTLSGTLTVTVGTGTAKSVVIGAAPSTGAAANTIYTGTGSGYNTLSGVAAAINAASSSVLTYTEAGTPTSTTYDSGTLTSVANAANTLSGSLTVQVGSGTAETVVIGAEPSSGAATDTIYTGASSGDNTLAGIASAINDATDLGLTATVTTATDGTATLTLTSGTAGTTGEMTVTSALQAGIGFTANVATSNGSSTMTLTSQTSGSSGGLTVASTVEATSDTALSFTSTDATSSEYANGSLTSISSSSDTLTGSISIQVGSGTATTVNVPASPSNTLSGLAAAINKAAIGVTASAVESSSGTWSLEVYSNTSGTDGDLTVTSSILDATNTTTAKLSYTNSSDINNLTTLGISVGDSGILTLDAASLDSVLTADYSSVVGFFQNANSWGSNFSTVLTDSGTSASTGILHLASVSNSNIESTLTADISKEEVSISKQEKTLTAELNSANEIMEEIPTELSSISELYSAITGYNQSSS
jgi:flagellar hook-associated protein 2